MVSKSDQRHAFQNHIRLVPPLQGSKAQNLPHKLPRNHKFLIELPQKGCQDCCKSLMALQSQTQQSINRLPASLQAYSRQYLDTTQAIFW